MAQRGAGESPTNGDPAPHRAENVDRRQRSHDSHPAPQRTVVVVASFGIASSIATTMSACELRAAATRPSLKHGSSSFAGSMGFLSASVTAALSPVSAASTKACRRSAHLRSFSTRCSAWARSNAMPPAGCRTPLSV